MRIPLAPVVDSRDGSTDKDAKAVNLLKEDDDGAALLALRPGLATISSNTGNGNGLVDFDGVLISVFGTVAGFGSTPSSAGTVVNGRFDFAQGAL